MNKISNKQLVLDFYKRVVKDRNGELIDLYISDNYIQHSPSMKDGKAGLREAIEYLKLLPKPQEQGSPIVLAIAEGDFVMLLLDLAFMGKHLSVADLFKVVDGKIIEHWDASEELTLSAPLFQAELDGESNEGARTLVQSLYENSNRAITALYNRSFVKIHRMIIEGSIVGVQAEGHKNGKPFVFYDFIKLKNLTVANFLSVEQQIPDNLNHNNGML